MKHAFCKSNGTALLYTFVSIAARAFGKYFGAKIGATLTHMPNRG